LLPNGRVLVAGGVQGITYLTSAELYIPASGTWTYAGYLSIGRGIHTATVLPSGKVLIAGGWNDGGVTASAELYDVGLGFNAAWQPQIATVTSPLGNGQSLALTGSRFRGVSEGSSGGTQDSPADYPVVQLRRLDNEQTSLLLSTNWSATSFNSAPVTNLASGYALVTMFVNGIPSPSSLINLSAPPPRLWVTYTSTNTVVVWWPVPNPSWQLEATTNFVTAGSVWKACSHVTNGANCLYIVSPPTGKCFYRLTQ
jgi:hypothetical protein